MKTVIAKVENVNSEKAVIEEAGRVLRSGGLVGMPTETVYGLAANALDEKAVKKIFEAKGRPSDNPLIVHVADESGVPALVEKVDERFYPLAEKFWPGALTIIMKKSTLVPFTTSGGLDTVAIRCPSHPVAHAIIKASGVPIAAPSANTSGKPSPTTAKHVADDMDGKIEMIVDGGRCGIGVESTVITLVTDPPRLLRPGGVTPEQIREILPDLEIDPAVFSKLEAGVKVQSPGMKYKHYSPDADVILLKGSLEGSINYIKQHADSSCCAVCFEGEENAFGIPSIVYGRKDDGLSLANNVFDVLRELDSDRFRQAFVRCPDPTGVGLAVYNRLLRSAAFRVVDVDKTLPVIGLTGPSGAGKSTVSRYFEENGFYIIDGDALARQAVKNKNVLEDLALAFGSEVINPDGSLNRQKTADIAFSSAENTKKLNSITHPAITALTNIELAKAAEEGARGAVIDAAALLESPIAKMCNIKACVMAKKDERAKRIMARDSLTGKQAYARIDAQQSDEYYLLNTDFAIPNSAGDDFRRAADTVIKAAGKIK